MVSARASENGAALGQVKTDDRSNETAAIPELLKFEGCVVAIDAMGCQKNISKEIAAQGAGYVLAVKKNQPRLREDIADAFDYA